MYLADFCQLISDVSMRRPHSTDTDMTFTQHLLATDGWQLLDHVCGTRCPQNYTIMRQSRRVQTAAEDSRFLFKHHGALLTFS